MPLALAARSGSAAPVCCRRVQSLDGRRQG